MKKIIKIFIIIIITLITLVITTGCSKTNVKEGKDIIETTKYPAKVISVNYNYNFEKENHKVIISNYEELDNYCKNLDCELSYIDDGKSIGTTLYIPKELSIYNDEYFKNKSLALIYVEFSSGGNEIELKNVIRSNNKVNVEYSVNHPEIGTTVMDAKLIVIEVDKDITEIDVI